MTGIRFTETMRGFCSTSVADDFARADEQGRRDGSRLEFTVTIASDDLDAMLTKAAHEARITGSVTAPALSAQPMQVTDGVFNLFVADPGAVHARQMRYRMALLSEEGRRFRLEGFKQIHDDPGADIWADTTTLFVTISDDPGGTVRARGILHILPNDFMRQMTTMEVTGAPSPAARLDGLVRFGRFFAGVLFDIYGGVFSRPTELQPGSAPRVKRPLKMDAPEVHFPTTDDGVRLRLTRYRGGAKGPVMLSPGFGTSTFAFSADTVETNLPEFLFARAYDVWLFDYRASPELPSARTQFTLDDIATRDYPAAVSKVLEVSGAPTVQMMAHCIGSMTFLMAMLAGLEGVRSAVCSALSFYPLTPLLNRIRADLDLGAILKKAGVDTMTTDFDPRQIIDRVLDDVLKMFPGEPCDSAVCRRIQGIYGDVYKHGQLNDATHKALHEMFGVANLTTFNQISLMVRTGHIVDSRGNDVYLPNIHRLSIPITFFHGAENNLFLPEGTARTFQLLCKENDARLYHRVVVPNYAHMDCFIGKNAETDVYPLVALELDQHN